MRKIHWALMVTAAGLLSACGGSGGKSKSDGQTTETRMDDVDIIEGTIDDEMIDVDESTDDAPLARDEDKSGDDSGSDDGDDKDESAAEDEAGSE